MVVGQIGTAMGQQSLRGVLSFCNARQMTAPEAYIHFLPEEAPCRSPNPCTEFPSTSA